MVNKRQRNNRFIYVLFSVCNFQILSLFQFLAQAYATTCRNISGCSQRKSSLNKKISHCNKTFQYLVTQDGILINIGQINIISINRLKSALYIHRYFTNYDDLYR